ncbi:hypothetical protein COCNU_scaffold001677G000110 [Cocos nucifera]|nr:hypothetical protein [Cocos nucifera]
MPADSMMEPVMEVTLPASSVKITAEDSAIRATKVTKTIEFMVPLIHYLNEFMEYTVGLLTEATKHKMDIKTLKSLKDRALKEAREASVRADAVKRRAQDTKTMLKKSVEENSRLLGIKEALMVKVEELKAQSAKASEEYKDEKAEFTIDAYDERKHFIRSRLAFQYPELNLNFLDGVPEVPVADMAGAPIDSKIVL